MTARQGIRRWATVLAAVCWLAGGGVRGQSIPEPMSPPRLVNDYAHLFSGSELQVLEDSLRIFEAATSTQIAVVTVTDLEDYPAGEYATRLMERWGVGTREHDNGVVLLLKPRNRYGGGDLFIAVGYGLEGALPDITAASIIDGEMMPYLQGGDPDYYAATAAGTRAIRDAVRGEYTAREKAPEEEKADLLDWLTRLLTLGVLIWMVGLLVQSYRKRGSDDDDPPRGSGGHRTFRRPLRGFGGFGGFGRFGTGGGSTGGGFGGFGGGRTGGGGAGRSF